MKLTNTIKLGVLLLSSSTLLAFDSGAFKQYFIDSSEEELIQFRSCIQNEGLDVKNQINTKCQISKKLSNATFLIADYNINKFNILPNYKSYKKISSSKIRYPKNMLNQKKEGYIALSFDINELGRAEDVKVIEELCGNVKSPFTQYKECKGFEGAAVYALKRFIYEPSQYDGKAIRTNNVEARLTFFYEPSPVTISKRERLAASKSEKAFSSGNYEKAFEEAARPNLDHRMLDFLASKAKFYLQEYEEAAYHMNRFIADSENSKNQFSESMMAESLSIVVTSLFNQNKFSEIVEYEKAYAVYFKERKGFKELLVTTNLYIGIAFINTGNLQDGIFYLGLAYKYSNNQIQQDYISNLYNQVSSYL